MQASSLSGILANRAAEGQRARIDHQKPKPPQDLAGPDKVAWLFGYYEQVGYERASGGTGMTQHYDTDGVTFCSKCRSAGYSRYYAEAEVGSRSAAGAW